MVKQNQQPVTNNQKDRQHPTPAEYEYHRKNKLCYKCSEKRFYGHVCANKELQVLTLIEGCEVELIEEEFFDTVQDEGGIATELMELSLNVFLG